MSEQRKQRLCVRESTLTTARRYAKCSFFDASWTRLFDSTYSRRAVALYDSALMRDNLVYYFVTGERWMHEPRRYTVRVLYARSGWVDTFGGEDGFEAYATSAEAWRAIDADCARRIVAVSAHMGV